MKKLERVLTVLKKLEDRFEEEKLMPWRFSCYGMCAEVTTLKDNDKISKEDQEAFQSYYNRSKKGQKWFYTYTEFKTTDRSQFGWKPSDLDSRYEWIKLHIKRIESGKSVW